MISLLLRSPLIRQFAKFTLVGCGNAFVSFVVFVFFYRYFPLGTLALDATGPFGLWIEAELARLEVHSIDAGLANAVGYVAGMVNSFLLNKHWTFGATGMTTLQLHRFVVLNVAVVTGSTLLIFFFVDVLQAHYLPAWIATTGLAMMANFLGNKFWTFAETGDFGTPTARASTNGST